VKRAIPVLLALLCAGGWFLLNLLYLSHYLDLDIVKYYHDQAAGRLFHPHHLLFSFQGYLAVESARMLGYTGHGMLILQLVVLCWGSILAGLLFLAFFHLTARTTVALLLTGLTFFSHGVWSYATLNDTPLIPALLALLTLLVGLVKGKAAAGQSWQQKIRTGFVLALLHTLAIGFHQTMVLLLPGLTLILLFSGGRQGDKNHRLILPVSYILFTVSLVSFMYVGAGLLSGLDFARKTPFPGIPAGLTFFEWVLVYGHWDRSVGWGTFQRYDIPERIAMGATGMLVSDHADAARALAQAYISLLILSVLVLLFKDRQQRAALAGVLCWLGAASLLASWWEPEHYEHWFGAFMASVALVALGLRSLGKWVWPILPLLFFFILGMATLNFRSTIEKRNQGIVFGYWEDLYDMANYTTIWNPIYRKPLAVRGGRGNQSARRLMRKERLQKLLENEGLRDFHAKYRKELEQVEAAIERTENRNPD